MATDHARELCREVCAFRGDPPCWKTAAELGEEWLACEVCVPASGYIDSLSTGECPRCGGQGYDGSGFCQTDDCPMWADIESPAALRISGKDRITGEVIGIDFTDGSTVLMVRVPGGAWGKEPITILRNGGAR